MPQPPELEERRVPTRERGSRDGLREMENRRGGGGGRVCGDVGVEVQRVFQMVRSIW